VAAGDRGLTGDPEREGRFRENVSVALELARSMGYRKMKVLVGHALAGMDRAGSSSRWRCGTSGTLADEARKAGKVFAAMSTPAPSRLKKGRLNELVPDIKRISAAFSEAFGSF
jgi:hypothetical protein